MLIACYGNIGHVINQAEGLAALCVVFLLHRLCEGVKERNFFLSFAGPGRDVRSRAPRGELSECCVGEMFAEKATKLE